MPDENLELFKVRYNLEKQVRRIWEGRFFNEEFFSRSRRQPVLRIIQDLVKYEVIDNNFYNILREILSICNYAIHGESVTDKQISFVKKNSPQVLDYLLQTK